MPRNGYIKVDEVPDSLNPKLFVVKEDISQFECPLCLEVFNDPKQCKRGHVFCRECIVEALKKCENCPICSEPLTEATMSSCLFVKQQIASRQVYCFTRLDELEATGEDKEEKNGAKKEGRKKAKIADVCTWTGKLEDAEKHFHACPYAGVLCKYAPECNLADYRKDIHEHEKNCCYRTVPCKWCGVELKPNGPLAQHQALCDKQEVPCSNWGYGCRLKVPKDELKLHETTCGWFRVPCPLAATAGCTAWICRKDVDTHLAEAAQQHNQLFLKAMGGLQREILELKSVVMNVTHEMTMQVRVDELSGQKAIAPKYPAFPTRIYSAATNLCGYQALLYVETVHPEGRNDFGVYLNLAGDASASFPCRVEYSVRLVHHDGKPSSSYFIKGPSGGAVFANRGASWGWRSFVVVKDRITVADSPYVKTVQLPAEAIPDPIPVAAAGSGFIDLTGDDLPPPAPVPVAVATFVATFRFLPLA